jgi:putative ABC transport system permease protein
MAQLRTGLLGEIVTMSWDTLRTSKMRSALTVLGVVIGITSIVGMTSLIRGFDNSLRDSIKQLGPNTLIVQKWGALSFASGKSFLEVARRPNLSKEDALRSSATVRRSGSSTSGSVRSAIPRRASTTVTSRRSRS